MTHRPSDPSSQVATVLDPVQRAVLIEGRDGLPARVPGRAFRAGQSAASWRALSASERAEILDRLAPLGSDPAVLLSRAIAALAQDPAPSTTRTTTRATAAASTSAPRRASVPAPAHDETPTPPSGEAHADATLLQLSTTSAPTTGTVVPCAGCSGFVPARGLRPRLAYCSTSCRPKPKGRRHRAVATRVVPTVDGYY